MPSVPVQASRQERKLSPPVNRGTTRSLCAAKQIQACIVGHGQVLDPECKKRLVVLPEVKIVEPAPGIEIRREPLSRIISYAQALLENQDLTTL